MIFLFCGRQRGERGGVAMIWRKTVSCTIINLATNFINIEISDGRHMVWRLMCFYGYSKRSRRRDSWRLLKDLSGFFQLSWCIFGDFNDLLSVEDKCGRVDPPWLLSGFRETIRDCNLCHIQLEEYPFTWARSQVL